MRFLCSECRKILSGERGEEVECQLCHAVSKAPENRLAPGSVIGDFAIVREISRGGVGIVFLARQLSLDRPVALKVLQEKFTKDKEFIDNFFREARAAARITHANIVQAYAVGEEDGVYYFAMEFIDGYTMKEILARDKVIPPKEAAEIVLEISGALDCAWNEQQIVHQDIKPDNIMITRRGQAKLADLGLARVVSGDGTVVDHSDEVMGTPQYINPEQLTGVPTDIRSDIYSLGATFYHFVTGKFPYSGKDGDAIARQHVEGTLTQPLEVVKTIPKELNRIIVKMMEKDINQRYQTAAELINDLSVFLATMNGVTATTTTSMALHKLVQPSEDKPQEKKKTQLGGANLSGVKGSLLGQGGASKEGGLQPADSGGGIKLSTPTSSPTIEPKAETTPEVVEPKKDEEEKDRPRLVLRTATPEPEEEEKPKEISVVKTEETPVAKAPKEEALPAEEKKNGLSLGKKKEEPTVRSAPPMVAKMEQEMSTKPPRDFTWVKTLAKVLGGLIVAVVVFFGGVWGLSKSGKTPEKLVPIQNAILKPFGLAPKSDDESEEGKTGEDKAEEKVEEKVPEKPVGPQTRPKFIEGVDLLLTQLRTNPSAEMEFLKSADEFFIKYRYTLTEEEATKLKALQNVYGRIDDRLRIAPAREKALAKHRALLEELRLKEERRIKAEEDRRAEQKRIADALAAEDRQAAAEIEKRDRALHAEIQRRSNEYVAKMNENKKGLGSVFFSEVSSENVEKWNNTIKPFLNELSNVPINATIDEKKTAQMIVNYARNLDEEFKKVREVYDILHDKNKISQITIELAGHRLVRAEKYDADILTAKDGSGQEFKLDLKDASVRNVVVSRIERRFKLSNVEFYYAMLAKNFDNCKADSAPSPFLRSEIGNMVSAYKGKVGK